MGGYFKVWRKIEDSKSWSRGALYRGLMITLLQKANWKQGYFHGQEILPGQLACSGASLASELDLSRYQVMRMLATLEDDGFTMVPFGQGFKDMSPPTKELMKLVLEEKIAHGGHPVLRWMMDNIFIRSDPAGNIKPDKEKSTEKIDGAVATIMALDRAIRCGNDNGESVYDTRGLLFI